MDYEQCARCGHDHEYESQHAQDLHANCRICIDEVQRDRIGDNEDHDCADNQLVMFD